MCSAHTVLRALKPAEIEELLNGEKAEADNGVHIPPEC
jgi:hypothetical protein